MVRDIGRPVARLDIGSGLRKALREASMNAVFRNLLAVAGVAIVVPVAAQVTFYEGGPAYWDVTYNFRGQEHRVQMSAPPGTTVTVNELGEPRQ
jgi:hypothetical protein